MFTYMCVCVCVCACVCGGGCNRVWIYRCFNIYLTCRLQYLIYFADGHHKLIRWRFVMHGGIDGYSRMIVFLKFSTNNRASTVLESFQAAVQDFGLPSRVRSDQGRENYLVGAHMLHHRGVDRQSMITGNSTHNQRIERLWRDTHRSVTILYYRLFYFLESQGLLDPLNEIHIFALHYVYLVRINRALDAFKQGWNHHGIRTAHSRSPHQLFTSGTLRLHSSGLCALDFLQDVGQSYGIDHDETAVPASDDGVSVPESRLAIPEPDLQRLKHQLDPLSNSDNYGTELYEQVVDFVVLMYYSSKGVLLLCHSHEY